MDALELLMQQHDEVDELIADIEATDDADARQQLFEELADKVTAHASVEESLFYPAVLARQTEEILIKSVGEHLALKHLLADLIELDTEDDEFDVKLAVMKEQLAHHAHEEEEAQLFPKVRTLLTQFERDALGHEMLVRYLELLDEEPRFDVLYGYGALADASRS